MKHLISLTLVCLPACTLFGGLTDEEQKKLDEHRFRAQRYFNHGKYDRAVDQAQRGLALDKYHYDLRSTLGWAYLELASQFKENNVEHLRRSRLVFEEIIEWRDPEDHDSRTIFGYAKALYNQARLDELEADLRRKESNKPEYDKNKASEFVAAAEEFEKLAKSRDLQSEQYFKLLVDGDTATRANKKEAYEYLMVLGYRSKDYDKAITYGNKTLEFTANQTKHWSDMYKTTASPDHERVLRDQLRSLQVSEKKVRSALAKYHREKGTKKDYEAAIDHLTKVISFSPNSYEEYYRRGLCYRNAGEPIKAREDFQTFLRLSSLPEGNPQVQDAREFLYGKGK